MQSKSSKRNKARSTLGCKRQQQLGEGKFGICKLVSLSVSGESVKVAVKHYTELTTKEAVVDEASLLSRISHEAFPFVFGVVFGELHNMLVLEV